MTKEQATREALEKALTALENSETLINGTDTTFGLVGAMDGYYSDCFDLEENEKLINQAIIAIEEALQSNERPQNCGTSYCSCIECVMEPSNEQVEPEFKLMPRKATREMLEAMDECSMEGYDERLYAGHASSVYMAAWDAFNHPPVPTEQTEQVEPVNIGRELKMDFAAENDKRLAQQSNEQVEPVAWRHKGEPWRFKTNYCINLPDVIPDSWEPLFTHPPVPTAQPEEPMDTPLPCDVKVGHVNIRKGVALRTLVARMQVLYDMAQAPRRKPLNEQFIMDSTRELSINARWPSTFVDVWRLCEESHGIKE